MAQHAEPAFREPLFSSACSQQVRSLFKAGSPVRAYYLYRVDLRGMLGETGSNFAAPAGKVASDFSRDVREFLRSSPQVRAQQEQV